MKLTQISQYSVILSEAKSPCSALSAKLKALLSADILLRRHKEFLYCLRLIFLAVIVLTLVSSLAAQTLTGTVKNSTTGKPSVGDDVVLLKLGQGMEEAGRTQSDAKGNFTFKLDDAQSPHLVRAIHQGVTYHRMAPPGTTSVEVQVYDVGKKIDGIDVVADVMRLQVEQGQLEIIRMFAVQNSSKPPRTEMNDRSLEFRVPEGAQIVEGSATTDQGNPLKTAPVQESEKNRYSFIFPLRPGTTQFAVAYQLSYTGSANIDPKSIYPLQHFVAILPKSMPFTAASSAIFKQVDDPSQPDAFTEVASNTTLGQNLAFKISGEGTLQERGASGGQPSGGPQTEDQQGSAAGGQAQLASRPGGGLGPPIDAPDPLQKYRWQILGGFAAVLILGAIFVASRQQAAARAGTRPKLRRTAEQDFADEEAADSGLGSRAVPSNAEKSRQVSPQFPQPQRPSSMLLEGLKEELFQLEVDRNQGRISQQEYEQAKSAMDHTLERALKREAQKA